MGTNDFVNQLINLGNAPFAPNWIVDVHDVARGHVLALPLPASVGNGRFIIPLDKIPQAALPGVNTTKAKEALGLWRVCHHGEDAMDDLLVLEKLWAKAA
jgi:hypothetical protein